MEIRNFLPQDAGEIIELWNGSLQADKAGAPWYIEETALDERKFATITTSPNFDPTASFVACDGGEIVGFARCAVKTVKSYDEEDLDARDGSLEGLVVRASHRRRGLATQLLQRVDQYVRAHGKLAVSLSLYQSVIRGVCVLVDSPEYHCLAKNGYISGLQEMRLHLSFDGFCMREEVQQARDRLASEGVEIGYCESKHRESFARLMEDQFQSWWYHMFRPNLRSESPKEVLIATEGERVVGFVGFVHVSEGGKAGFSPGVDTAFRRRGIGKVLVNVWAEEVKRLGARQSVISTGMKNTSAQRIYFGMGYRKIGEFWCRLTKSP